MSEDVLVTRLGRLACFCLTAVLATVLLAAFCAASARAARVLPLPRVQAETYQSEFEGRSAVVLDSLLVRRIHGTLRVSCNQCQRFTKRRVLITRPSRMSKRFRHADWILLGGRAVKIKVTRKGWTGRYLMLTAQRRTGRLRLRYKESGCLSRRGRQVHCPRDVPPPPRPGTIVQTQPVPAPAPAPAPTTNTPQTQPAVRTEGVIYAVNQAGDLMWYRHGGWEDGSLGWPAARRVGSGWGDFTDVFSGGSGVIYAIQPSGDLMWYRHGGRADGSLGWSGPKKVGTSWASFKYVFSGGGGVIYAIQPNGDMWWYRHGGFEDGTWSWLPRKKVGAGWGGFTNVFSGGSGVIYAIQPNGDLLWYRHPRYADGTAGMAGPKKVGSGWTGFKDVFAGSGGVIYGVKPNGDLMWYRHLGREDGSSRWLGPKLVGSGWAAFKRIVPAPA
jgi:hypothetical protein